jgi:hypothetical protein
VLRSIEVREESRPVEVARGVDRAYAVADLAVATTEEAKPVPEVDGPFDVELTAGERFLAAEPVIQSWYVNQRDLRLLRFPPADEHDLLPAALRARPEREEERPDIAVDGDARLEVELVFLVPAASVELPESSLSRG